MRRKDLNPTREWLRANKKPVFTPGGLSVKRRPSFFNKPFPEGNIMRKKAIVFLIVYCLAVFTGCSAKGKEEPFPESTPISNSAADIKQGTKERPETRKSNIASSTPSLPGLSPANEFSIFIGEKYITLDTWDYEADIPGVLGEPLQETERVLGDEADTHAGSTVKTQGFEGIVLYLFTPDKDRGFWISRMVVTNDRYITYRGVSVGCSHDKFKGIYPEANMALDGRTDPNNCAYTFYQGDQYIRFEFKDGVITKIEYRTEKG